MDDIGFVWAFPCYILVGQYAKNPRTGHAVIDDNLTFVVGERTPCGEKCVLIFTDSDLAERHRLGCPQARSLGLLGFNSPSQLRDFLEQAKRNYRMVAVDVNRKTGRVHGFAIADIIASLDISKSSSDTEDQS